jgi:hypothetical protein
MYTWKRVCNGYISIRVTWITLCPLWGDDSRHQDTVRDKRFSYSKSYGLEIISGRCNWGREGSALSMFFNVVTLFKAPLNRSFSGPLSSGKSQTLQCVLRQIYHDAAL